MAMKKNPNNIPSTPAPAPAPVTAPTPPAATGMIAVAQQREVAETQAKMMIARMNPRNEQAALDRILNACTRPGLAEAAMYSYVRGGTDISGPSIRLAEAMAQQWGNLDFGVRELESRDGVSTVEAYAWDIETNVVQRKIFQVAHTRWTKRDGNTILSDPRDIYETIANNGARRLRACILGIIPGDVAEAAVKQCETTLAAKISVTPERISKLVETFAAIGVTKDMLEKRIQRRIEAITAAGIVQLGKIYNSIKDGMSKPGDWFGAPDVEKGVLNIADLKPTAPETEEKK